MDRESKRPFTKKRCWRPLENGNKRQVDDRTKLSEEYRRRERDDIDV